MHILVSFCNVGMPGRPALAVLDADTSECRVVQFPKLRGEVPRWLSITGLAASAQHIYAALQMPITGISKLLVLDHSDLRLLNNYHFRLAKSVHSLWVSDERLYVVSTGTDEVIELQMQGPEVISEAVFWRPEPASPRADIHHLNAICEWRGDLLVAGFGKKTGQLWNSIRDGFVFNITRSEKIVSGILQPHSLAAIGDMLAYCESVRRAVRVIEAAHVQHLPGYTRGLCLAGQKLFVGTSIGRRVSKSTGILNNPDAPGVPAGQCTVSCLSLHSFKIEKTIDLSAYGDEIYDLLPIDGTGRWPVISEHSVRSSDATWRNLIAQEIVALVPPGDTFILVDHEAFRTELTIGRSAIPFLERDGQYWGPPPDDITAIRELERLRGSGASFIVFAWPAFWWLDYYSEFYVHLCSQFRCLLDTERLVVFDLRR